MFATKETTFITLGTMAIARLCIWAREKIDLSAAKREFPTKIFAAAATGSILLAFVLSSRLPEVATDFGKRMVDLTKAGSADTFTNLFYFLVAVVPPILVYLVYAWDKSTDEAPPPVSSISLRGFRDAIGNGPDRTLAVAAAFAIPYGVSGVPCSVSDGA